MTDWITGMTAWISLHPTLAYLFVFLLALSESIPVIGVVVPGTAAIIAISTLVPTGSIKLWPLIAVAFAGAVVGDGVPFWIGHRYHASLLQRWPLARYPKWVAKSESFINKHGDKSVFLARFTPGVRAFVPLFAGILKMSARRFYLANTLSAAIWAPTHILPGVLLGATFSHLGVAAIPIASLIVIVVLFVWITVKIVRYLVLYVGPVITGVVSRLHVWARKKEYGSTRVLARLLDPSRVESRAILLLGAVLVASAWLFLGVLEDVVGKDPLVRLDTAIYLNLQALRSSPGDAVMIAITEVGDATVVVSVAIAVLAWLLIQRAWRTAAYWTVAIAGASLLNTVIKVTLHRTRPGEELYSGWSAFSFPSGHSTINVVLYGFLALLVVGNINQRARLPVIVGAALLASLIAFSRLYLGAHWVSDVVAGMAFGGAWVAFLGIYYLYGEREKIRATGLLAIACVVLMVAGSTHVVDRHSKDVETYAVETLLPSISLNDWRSGAWRGLPERRTDLSGEIEEPFTIQWAGSIKSIRTTLEANGWEVAPSWNLTGISHWLGKQANARELPVVPALNGGRLPGSTMIEVGADSKITDFRRILRLWPADLTIVGSVSEPLWQGSIIGERLYHPTPLFTVAWTPDGNGSPIDVLIDSLPNTELVIRSDTNTSITRNIAVILVSDQFEIAK